MTAFNQPLPYANTPGDDCKAVKATGLVTNFARLLRVVGALAVIASAVVYMLQGLQGTDDALRDWIYVILMVVLTFGGIACHQLFKDSVGARLFFALAAMLVPVQVTQLSAVLSAQAFGLLLHSMLPWLTVLSASFVAASIAVYFCFAVIARPYAKRLTAGYVVLNLLLLSPWRDVWSTLCVAILMLLVYAVVYFRVFSKDRRFSLWEGVLIRFMLLAPLAIVGVRFAFSVETLFGWSLLLESAALFMWAITHWLAKSGWYKTVSNVVALILAVLGNVGAVFAFAFENVGLPHEFAIYGLLVPSIVFTLFTARISDDSRFYHILASLGMVALTALVPHFDWSNSIVMLLMCVALLFFAFKVQSRLLFFTALLGGVLQFTTLLFLTMGNIQAVSWFALAITGVSLVALASFAERYGRVLLNNSAKRYQAVSAWGL